MKNIITSCFVASLFLITSCSNNDDNDAVVSPYAGDYTVLQAESDVPVDLDDDGTAHTNLMEEIAYFNNVPYDLLLEERANGYKLMSFYIPHPNIPDDMESFTVAYAHAGFGVQYEYSSATNEIKVVTDTNTDYYREFGIVESVEVIGTMLKCVIRKDYYDYQINDMKNIRLTLIFQKQAE